MSRFRCLQLGACLGCRIAIDRDRLFTMLYFMSLHSSRVLPGSFSEDAAKTLQRHFYKSSI